MKTDFRKAMGFAVMTLLASVALATPLAQASGFERPGVGAVISRMIGLGLVGIAMLLVVETPALLTIGWLIRGRMAVPRVAWSLVAGLLAMTPIVAMNLPGETVWVKISETVDAVRSQPVIFVTEWLPFVATGCVFGWHLFRPRLRSVATAG